jgi:hypothetical protein
MPVVRRISEMANHNQQDEKALTEAFLRHLERAS